MDLFAKFMINPKILILRLFLFPYLDGDVPRRTSYGIYKSQLIRFARASSPITDFDTRNKLLTAKLLNHSYPYSKLRKALSKFYGRHLDLVSKFSL